MKLDEMTYGQPLATTAASVRAARERGYDGWFVSETTHDPFLAAAVAGQVSGPMQVGTAIAVAFPRSPMHVAYAAHDLQALTGGRFVLGLGSQIKPHIEKRFSTEWSKPAARMREYVLALKAIWAAWRAGEPLAFRGEFYRHTLMTPFFTPEDHGHGDPAVWLAAVGPLMTRVTGEVADGLLAHGFTTARYLAEVTLPNLAEAAAEAGRSRAELEVVLPVFVVTGSSEEQRAASEAMVRGQLAFYGSTPAYRAVLELHGWGALHEELHAASVSDRWAEMPAMIPTEVLETFAVVAEPDELGAAVRARYGGLADRVSLSSAPLTDEQLARVRADLRDR
ncbi:MAG: TIGR03617 family F420-dependent LLM class oxidoreductase [Nitriliruptoraceae bacterium]